MLRSGVRKRTASAMRTRTFLQAPRVRALIRIADAEGDREWGDMTTAGYVGLLRFKSECVPLCKASEARDSEPLTIHSAATLWETEISIRLRRRKNRPRGAFVRRVCACKSSAELCLVHRLKQRWEATGDQGRLFHMSYEKWLRRLRRRLAQLGEVHPERYAANALRRGAATDVFRRTGSIAAVLHAGDWSSPAFLKYLKEEAVEPEAVAAALADASDDE